MRFFKYYLPLIFKLIGTQMIISLLSMMLYGTLSDIPVLLIIGMTLALCIYYYLQHRTVWEHACKESMKHPDLQMHIGPVTGLLVGLASGIPAFLLNLVPVIWPMTIISTGTNAGDISTGFSYLCYTIGKFLFNGQYIAIIHSFFPLVEVETKGGEVVAQNGANILASVPYYLLTILPVAFICWFSYWLGLKDKTILGWLKLDHLFQANPKKKEDRPAMKK